MTDITEIEGRLPGILRAEADRYEVPVFSAQRIAENAVRKGFWRQRPVLLLAAIGLAGAAGASGAVVAANGHEAHDRVTVTVQDPTPALTGMPSLGSADETRTWIAARVKAEGLKGVHITVTSSPLTITVTGRAADTERLKMLVQENNLMMMRMRTNFDPDHSGTTLPLDQCSSRQEIGPPIPACDAKGHLYAHTTFMDGTTTRVIAAHAERLRPGPDGWGVVLRLDADAAQRLQTFTAAIVGSPDQMVAQAGHITLAVTGVVRPITDGTLHSSAGFTEQQAKDIATGLVNPGPVSLISLAAPTVSPAPRGAD